MTDWNDLSSAPALGTAQAPLSEAPDNGAKEYVFGEGRAPSVPGRRWDR